MSEQANSWPEHDCRAVLQSHYHNQADAAYTTCGVCHRITEFHWKKEPDYLAAVVALAEVLERIKRSPCHKAGCACCGQDAEWADLVLKHFAPTITAARESPKAPR